MIYLDYKDHRPIYEQVIDKIKELILLGVWKENEALPSVRSLAVELSINPNTIQRAYSELERQGYIYIVKGRGSFVAENSEMKELRKQEVLEDFRSVLSEAGKAGIRKDELMDILSLEYNDKQDDTGGGLS